MDSGAGRGYAGRGCARSIARIQRALGASRSMRRSEQGARARDGLLSGFALIECGKARRCSRVMVLIELDAQEVAPEALSRNQR